MKISILSLFPNMFDGFLNESIIKRAREKGIVDIEIINFRDFSTLNNNQVDDTPYGGGAGMVLMCEPIYRALESVKNKDSYTILLTPDGNVYNQTIAKNFSAKKHIILICGHYEGFDERIRSFVDAEISIGDYVLTGGEIPAMAITDSVVRLLDGAIKEESALNESFSGNLLDYPVYTKPRDFLGMSVPEILLSGDHKKIAEWRMIEQIKRTKEKRPDLLD